MPKVCLNNRPFKSPAKEKKFFKRKKIISDGLPQVDLSLKSRQIGHYTQILVSFHARLKFPELIKEFSHQFSRSSKGLTETNNYFVTATMRAWLPPDGPAVLSI